MGISVVELVKAKVREVEDLDRQLESLGRRRDALVAEITEVRETLGAVALASAPAVSTDRTDIPEIPKEVAARKPHAQLAADVELIRRALTAAPEPLGRGDIAAHTGLACERAKYVIDMMRARGWLVSHGSRSHMRYTVSEAMPVPPTRADRPLRPHVPLPGPDPTLEVSWHGGMQTSPRTGQSLTDPDPVEAYRQRSGGSIA